MRDPVRFSRLRHMARSPAHYQAALDDSRDTPAMRLGRLVHALVLGGGEFVVWDAERRGKAWIEFRGAHPKADIVTAHEHAHAMRIADAVRADRAAVPLLVGERECRIDWEMLGRACTSRLDVLGDNFGDAFVTELKTSTNVAPGRFGHFAVRMGYHAQLAFYADAARALGRDVRSAYIVAVETAAPFAVTTFRLTPRALEDGRKLCRLWMERLLACEEEDTWPAYCQTTVELDVPEDVELMIDGEEVAA